MEYNGKCKCIKCGEDMIIDDCDYNFKGCFDNYWYCIKCDINCWEKVRFGNVCKRKYFDNNGEVINEKT